MSPAAERVSLIVRTKNEEKWLRHSLEMVAKQTFQPLEVLIVDSGSTDMTIEIARKFEFTRIIKCNKYSPGRSLNLGASQALGDIIAMMSAHCIPVHSDWLGNLVAPFAEDTVAGVYGKQLPLSHTSANDRNDLYLAFRDQRIVQDKDFFFHNANSAIRKSVWEMHSFDEQTQSLEDRIWAKEVIESGYTLVYEPSAGVYHHNGLHRSESPQRLKTHVEIFENELSPDTGYEVETLMPKNTSVYAIVTMSERDSASPGSQHQFAATLRALKESPLAKAVFGLGPEEARPNLASNYIARELITDAENMNLDELIGASVRNIESSMLPPDFYLYTSFRSGDWAGKNLEKLVSIARARMCDVVFPARKKFTHHWMQDTETGDYVEIDTSFSSREKRSPIFEALYGLGTLMLPSQIRANNWTGGQIGILEVESDVEYI